jgi:hypothetical protein
MVPSRCNHEPLVERLELMTKRQLIGFGIRERRENVRLQKRIGSMRSEYRKLVTAVQAVAKRRGTGKE